MQESDLYTSDDATERGACFLLFFTHEINAQEASGLLSYCDDLEKDLGQFLHGEEMKWEIKARRMQLLRIIQNGK